MKKNLTNNRIAVVGGGASGLMAAWTAADNGSFVAVYEMKDIAGKKINATGNGKCNFTNEKMGPEYFRGENPNFVKSALDAFGVKEVIEFFSSIGIISKSKNGYYYPNSEEASSVSEALVLACREKGVKFIFEEVTEIRKHNEGFVVNGEAYDKVILSCGSFANMKNISVFNGYTLAKKLGHRVTALYPSLTQIRCDGKFFKTINGVRLEAAINIYSGVNHVVGEKGEILFTDFGVSGIPAFQVSRFCAALVDEKKDVTCELDFFPEISQNDLLEILRLRPMKQRTAEESLYGLLNHKLNFVLLNMLGINPTGSAEKELTDKNLQALSKLMKAFRMKVTGTNDFQFAQVVAGGIDTKEIDPETMESKKCPGLFVTGEVMDVDGTCGGYNLQWAWSSGHVAGVYASK